MKLYVTMGEPFEGPALITWSASQSEASKNATAMKAAFKEEGNGAGKDVTWHGLEVPTKKEDLIVFLNHMCSVGGIKAMIAARRITGSK